MCLDFVSVFQGYRLGNSGGGAGFCVCVFHGDTQVDSGDGVRLCICVSGRQTS